jgi:3-deoxy-7-phosphoheptulonate synthase
VDAACAELARAGLAQRLMVDASHANAARIPENQLKVCADVGAQLARGEGRVFGVMIESHLVAGRQDLAAGKALAYGQSVTDACLGWEDTMRALEVLAEAVRRRRLLGAESEDCGGTPVRPD